MRQRQASRPRLLQALIDAFSLPDLRRRILFTLGILVVFRFVANVPLPGVDPEALDELFSQNQFLGMLDLFSGGAMRNFSVVAMGVYPYITASIIMQLLVPVIPRLQALSKEGEAGRNKINVYTHWLTVPLAALQGYAQMVLLSRGADPAVEHGGALPTATMILALTAGTMFLVWLGELITERGIGNGVSMIIFAGIVAGLPQMVQRGFIAKEEALGLAGFAVLGLATVVLIVIFTEAHRRIPVHYSRSVFRGRRMYRQSGSTHIPLRVNTAGMIPLIFAMALMILPSTIASYFTGGVADFFQNWADHWSYWLIYFLLVVGFAFFYTMVIFEQMELAETLQRQGGFIPGVRPGQATATYLNHVVTRITWGGALFLALVAVMPFIVRTITGVQVVALSSTALLIMVGVALDTMKQLEAQLVMRRYEGFLR
ncbi:MAG: preprotein translocase subunit SecY [Chloroflexi bacterium]|mgnify:FL=1|nr:MAG: preprotein translocase subunit SecY [Chloroflexota bacterium]